ncbi:hypothetical protein ABPG72_008531 [Tetrahymena utriculariae]
MSQIQENLSISVKGKAYINQINCPDSDLTIPKNKKQQSNYFISQDSSQIAQNDNSNLSYDNREEFYLNVSLISFFQFVSDQSEEEKEQENNNSILNNSQTEQFEPHLQSSHKIENYQEKEFYFSKIKSCTQNEEEYFKNKLGQPKINQNKTQILKCVNEYCCQNKQNELLLKSINQIDISDYSLAIPKNIKQKLKNLLEKQSNFSISQDSSYLFQSDDLDFTFVLDYEILREFLDEIKIETKDDSYNSYQTQSSPIQCNQVEQENNNSVLNNTQTEQYQPHFQCPHEIENCKEKQFYFSKTKSSTYNQEEEEQEEQQEEQQENNNSILNNTLKKQIELHFQSSYQIETLEEKEFYCNQTQSQNQNEEQKDHQTNQIFLNYHQLVQLKSNNYFSVIKTQDEKKENKNCQILDYLQSDNLSISFESFMPNYYIIKNQSSDETQEEKEQQNSNIHFKKYLNRIMLTKFLEQFLN